MEILFFAKTLLVAQNTFHVQDTLFKTLNGKIAWLALSKNQDPENQTLCSLTRLGRTEPCNFRLFFFTINSESRPKRLEYTIIAFL